VPVPWQAVADDDDIIEAYEEQLAEPDPERPRSSRGFWIVVGVIVVAAVVLVVEIFANRDIKDSIAHAQFTLRAAQAAAESIETATGTFAAATPEALATEDPSLTYLAGDVASTSLDAVSVAATPTEWGVAVQARPGACFYVHLRADEDPLYGFGTECTGLVALEAIDPRW
jgi:hypothetical protein